MNYLTVNQAALRWGIAEQTVRKYVTRGRIPTAILEDGRWLIPDDAEKPGMPSAKEFELSRLLKRILYEKARNNHYGIYEYLQVNIAYSSSRMASNRITRVQVMDIYRTGKLCHNFEETKVDDIIETINHFAAAEHMIDSVAEPLSGSYIKNLHRLLIYGTEAERRHKVYPGAYRRDLIKKKTIPSVAPTKINKALITLIREYEMEPATLERILDFHVKFERIHPFDDYNGRVGRLLMLKECLRYGIDPFILDDKRRSEYFQGIINWDTDPALLTGTVQAAQVRLMNTLDTCKHMQYYRMPY